jgi:hypothetical protein
VQFENRPEREWHDGHAPVAERSCHFHGRRSTVEDDRFPVGQEASRSRAYRRFGLVELEGPNVVSSFLGTEKDTCRTAVHASQAPTPLQGFKVTPHGHLGAPQCDRQLPHQDRTALTEGLHDQLMPYLHIHDVQSTNSCVRSHIAEPLTTERI